MSYKSRITEKYKYADTTPMMRQWLDIKTSLTDEIVFCRVGDFYELFYDDAEIASKALDLQLTKRKIGEGYYPMAGVPHRSIEGYISRLINKGYKVAIIDQLEDAKAVRGKKTVSRGLTRIITRGTLTQETMLTPGKNNYLAAITSQTKRNSSTLGFAVCDLSTGDFRAAEFSHEHQSDFLRSYTKYEPVEILYPENVESFATSFGLSLENQDILSPKPEVWFDVDAGKRYIYDQFDVSTTKGYGFNDDSLATAAVGAILKYLCETQFTELPHLISIKSFDVADTMLLDTIAIRGLELFHNNQDFSSYGSFFSILNKTVTPMGTRLLQHWIANPLANRKLIDRRLTAVSTLVDNSIVLHQLRSILDGVGDIERLITRVSLGNARPDELIKLALSLETIPDLQQHLQPYQKFLPPRFIQLLDPCEDLVTIIRKSINPNPSGTIGEGGIIQVGYNQELDKLLSLKTEGSNWVTKFIAIESHKTGMKTMKVKQNNHFGYFIEISKKELDKVPSYYIKKQAMVNVSRFVTEELKTWETAVIEAEIQINEIEHQLYKSILSELSKFVPILQITANHVANLDCFANFAFLAERRNYVKPQFNDGKSLVIHAGRHPVIEILNDRENYIPNDICFDYDDQRLMIITGPNFSGKSSLLRATALIVIMAQIGCYVPAGSVELGVTDRIFTRIGASDNLVAGQSTFMLEMIDAANLVNNSTENSLVIADELGRGTSTYDGLAIAWAIAEHLHNSPRSPKTMIATHYHQLSELEGFLDSCVNFQFSIKFEEDTPIFDHKLVRGSSDKSFGVEVAKLSGLPNEVIMRARKILEILESKSSTIDPEGSGGQRLVDLIIEEEGQLSLENWFEGDSTMGRLGTFEQAKTTDFRGLSDVQLGELQVLAELRERLKNVDINTLSPVDAFKLIDEVLNKINVQ